MNLKNKIVKEVKDAVLAFNPKAKLILYGSRARGDSKQNSDWDFLVLTDFETTLSDELKLVKAIVPLEVKYNIPINILAESAQRFQKYSELPLHLEIKKQGIEIS